MIGLSFEAAKRGFFDRAAVQQKVDDAGRKSVVIGPTLTKDGSEAPRLLEHGGDTTLETREGPKRARYRPRPFMGPAFEAERPQLPALWKNSVR
jgi:hypothetical protein